MNIVMITDNDPAGMGIAFTNAINTHTDHRCRLITRSIRYNFNFEKDIHLPHFKESEFDRIIPLLHTADIIHFHMLSNENVALGPIRLKDYIKGKAVLHHHHGHPHFRNNPEKYRQRYKQLNRNVLVSTPDLLKLIPEAAWQPNLVPIKAPLLIPHSVSTNGTIKIGQSPTRKDLKNTEDLKHAVMHLQKKWTSQRISLNIIENNDYRECLRKKNGCHIIFDHMQGYFGVSSLESLSQGKPVICGLDDWNIRHIKRFAGTEKLPWIISRNTGELEHAIAVLATDTDDRIQVGQESRLFMEKHWNERNVIEKLVAVYEKM